MNAEGWYAALLKSDADDFRGFAMQLAEEDQAKQLLRDAGFGCTGMSLLLTVQAAVAWIAGAHSPDDGADGL